MVCPHCSRPFVDGARLDAGIFRYSASAGFSVRGVPLSDGTRNHELLGMVIEARGETVSDSELARTLGTKAADPAGLLAVQMSRLKRKMTDANADWPLQRVRGRGWRWNGPPVA